MPPVLNRYVPTNLSPMTQQGYDARYRTTAACVRTSLIKPADKFDAPRRDLAGDSRQPDRGNGNGGLAPCAESKSAEFWRHIGWPGLGQPLTRAIAPRSPLPAGRDANYLVPALCPKTSRLSHVSSKWVRHREYRDIAARNEDVVGNRAAKHGSSQPVAPAD